MQVGNHSSIVGPAFGQGLWASLFLKAPSRAIYLTPGDYVPHRYRGVNIEYYKQNYLKKRIVEKKVLDIVKFWGARGVL